MGERVVRDVWPSPSDGMEMFGGFLIHPLTIPAPRNTQKFESATNEKYIES